MAHDTASIALVYAHQDKAHAAQRQLLAQKAGCNHRVHDSAAHQHQHQHQLLAYGLATATR